MKYLLDTCVISELTKPQPNNYVLTWLEATQSEDLFLSVINIGELKKMFISHHSLFDLDNM